MGCGASNANAAVASSLPMPSDGTTMAPERQPPAAVPAVVVQQRAAPIVAGPPPPPPTPPSAPPPPQAGGIAGAAVAGAPPPSFARARSLQPFLSLGPQPAKTFPKSTKIVATLGPPSAKPAMLEKLILAGVNVFRLNFSHSSDHTDVIRDIRRISASLGRHTAILADLQGPKFRTGKTADGKPIPTVVGQRINLVTGAKQAIMDEKNIVTGTEHAHICVRKLEIGMRVLINDGAVVLKVVERKSSEELVCEVIVAGPVGQKKGINTPELTVPVPALTEKDEADAIYALAQDVDFMALSFVQRAADVTQLRDVIAKHILPGRVAPHIIAKIEKPSALDAIDSILEVVDGIMVARGDMGVECSLEKVPTFQKFLIRKANAVRKPVITATQMLESMITNASPTRAEVSDVFNAVLDGTDAVMLSGESAVGAFPLEAVSMMASIVLEAEAAIRAQKLSPPKVLQTARFDLSIADSAVYAAFDMNASAIVAVSKHAGFASYLSKSRPLCPIVCVTFSPKVASLLELCFGCHTLVLGESKEGRDTSLFKSSDAFLLAVESGIKHEHLGLINDDTYIFCCSEAPLPGMTNTLQLLRFGHVTELMGRPPMGHADWYAPDTTPVSARGSARGAGPAVPLPVVAGAVPIASTPVVEIHVPS